MSNTLCYSGDSCTYQHPNDEAYYDIQLIALQASLLSLILAFSPATVRHAMYLAGELGINGNDFFCKFDLFY